MRGLYRLLTERETDFYTWTVHWAIYTYCPYWWWAISLVIHATMTWVWFKPFWTVTLACLDVKYWLFTSWQLRIHSRYWSDPEVQFDHVSELSLPIQKLQISFVNFWHALARITFCVSFTTRLGLVPRTCQGNTDEDYSISVINNNSINYGDGLALLTRQPHSLSIITA